MGTLRLACFKIFNVIKFRQSAKTYFNLYLCLFCLFTCYACNQDGNTDSADNKPAGNDSAYITLEQIQFNGDTSKSGMVSIPGGEFMMGADNDQADPDEYPKHKVILDPYWIDQHEVTNNQFAKFISRLFV